MEDFEAKFKEMTVEEHRGGVPSVMYAEDVHDHLPKTYYTRSELEDIQTMYMGTNSEARKRYQRQGSFRRQFLEEAKIKLMRFMLQWISETVKI